MLRRPAHNARQTSPHPRRRRPRALRLRVTLTLLALGAATASMLAGSYASWTAGTSNPGNSVTAGTITISNSKDGQAVISSGTNIVPGDTSSTPTSFTVKNTGNVPVAVKLSQLNLTNGFAASSLKFTVYAVESNWCYYPTNAAGACPAPLGSTGVWGSTGSPVITNLAIKSPSGAAQWAPNDTQTFQVAWGLETTSPNADQGKSATFDLSWSAAA